MPGEFWYVMTVLLGFLLVAIVSFIIKRFVDKLEITIKSLVNNVTQLTINYKLLQETSDRQEKLLEDHEKDRKDLQKKRRL
mgnify:FL=1